MEKYMTDFMLKNPLYQQKRRGRLTKHRVLCGTVSPFLLIL